MSKQKKKKPDSLTRGQNSPSQINEIECLQEELDQYKAIVDNSPSMIFLKDRESNIVRANTRAAATCGVQPDDMHNKPSYEFFPDLAAKYQHDDMQVIESGKPKLNIIEHIDTDDRGRIWVKTDKYPWFDEEGNILGVAVYIYDISELKSKVDAAMQASSEKSAFLSHISHELRTPLTSILGFSKIILEKIQSQPKLQKMTQAIFQNSKYMQKIIDDLLDLAQIESGILKLNLRRLNVSEVLNDLERMFSQTSKAKGLTLSFQVDSEEDRFISDPVRLKQVLVNLVDNALKNTEKGGVIVRVDDYISESGRKSLRFVVQDSGIGIAKEDQEKVFGRFVQVGMRRNKNGFGLGLGLSRKIAESLGGRLILDRSLPGEGSTFIF